MTVLQAIILGLIQGLTEFLPISSSGHLALFGHWLGLEQADVQFDILVHLATLAAIAIFYWKDVKGLALMPFTRNRKDIKLFGFLCLATVPAAIIGLLFKDAIEQIHNHSGYVALFLIVTGVVLLSGLWAKLKSKSDIDQMNPIMVVVIGCAQALAILPGISRSGMTIMSGLYFGLKKEEAARFSFLMAIPAIAGAGVLMLRDIQVEFFLERAWAYSAGFITAFISSLLALKLVYFILKDRRFFYFGFYCLGLGLLALFLI